MQCVVRGGLTFAFCTHLDIGHISIIFATSVIYSLYSSVKGNKGQKPGNKGQITHSKKPTHA